MDLFQDFKLGVRLLARRPGFSAVAVSSLALGIGLNTTLFSVVNAILLRETTVRAPERLVEVYSSVSADLPQLTTSYPDYLAIRDEADTLSAVAAIRELILATPVAGYVGCCHAIPKTTTRAMPLSLSHRHAGDITHHISHRAHILIINQVACDDGDLERRWRVVLVLLGSRNDKDVQ